MSQKDFQAQVLEELGKMNRALYGDGTLTGDPGLVATVRTIQANTNTSNQRMWTVGIAVITAAATSWLKGVLQPS
jgi:hypothetical protein